MTGRNTLVTILNSMVFESDPVLHATEPTKVYVPPGRSEGMATDHSRPNHPGSIL